MRGGFLPPPLRSGFLTQPDSFVEDEGGGGEEPPADPMEGVTQDATSSKYVPANLTEWQTTATAAGLNPVTFVPSGLWLCQEASGNLADSIGSFTLTAAGTPTYQQNITGWARKGIVFDNGSTDAFSTAAAGIPNLTTTSHMLLAVMRFPSAAPAAIRHMLSMGGAGTRAVAIIDATPRLEIRSGANITDGTLNPCDGATHVLVIRSNRTGAEMDGITENEKVSPAFSAAVAGVGLLIGNTGSGAADSAVLYAASFHGAAAEMSDAQIKSLLQTLGWTVAW